MRVIIGPKLDKRAILGRPYLPIATSQSTNPEPEQTPPGLTAFPAMVQLLGTCRSGEDEIERLEGGLARGEFRGNPDGPFIDLLRGSFDQMQETLNQVESASRPQVASMARREATDLLNGAADARARGEFRFVNSAIANETARIADRIRAKRLDPAAAHTTISDLIDAADLDAPQRNAMLKASLQTLSTAAKEPQDGSTDRPRAVVAQTAAAASPEPESQTVRPAAATAAVARPSDREDAPLIEVDRQGKSDRLDLPRDLVREIAGKIRQLNVSLDKDRGNRGPGRSVNRGLELFEEARDHVIRETLRTTAGEDAAASFDDVMTAVEESLTRLRSFMHRQIEQAGARHGYSQQRIDDLKTIADAGVGTAMTILPGHRRGGRNQNSDSDRQDDRTPGEDDKPSGDDKGARTKDDQTSPGGTRAEFDPARIRLPRISHTRNPLKADELAKMEPGERIDPRRLRTLQKGVNRKYKPEPDGTRRKLIDTVRGFFENDKFADELPIINVFVDSNGDVWTLDHRGVVAARVATEIAETFGMDKVFKLRFRQVSPDSSKRRKEIFDKSDEDPVDGLSIVIRREGETR